jgi:iron-sulfur cluster repair protein YtfE (RIC family)
MTNFPTSLAPLEVNRRQLFATLDLLDQTSEPVIRADLASELVGISARYEDVKARAVYPALRTSGADSQEVDRAEQDQLSVRDALRDIRRRTQHVKPDYVHADDPEGFEKALSGLVEAIRIHTEHEDSVLFPVLAELDPRTSEDLLAKVEHAVNHASTHPDPPQNRVGRAIVAVKEKLEHDVKDESTQQHPGVDALNIEVAHRNAADD